MSRMQLALSATLFLQALVFIGLTARPGGTAVPADAVALRVGDTLRVATLADGMTATLPDTGRREWTLLFVFSAECQWCDSVAPLWEEVTRGEPRPPIRLVGVSRDSPAIANDYAVRHGWKLDAVLSLDATNPLSMEAQMTSRTPWYYLLDPAGRLDAIGHGAFLGDALDRVGQR